jgi:hypothetical protein
MLLFLGNAHILRTLGGRGGGQRSCNKLFITVYASMKLYIIFQEEMADEPSRSHFDGVFCLHLMSVSK